MKGLENLLSGGDLRSIGHAEAVIAMIKNQHDFDKLFKFLFHEDRIVVMRAADAIEKITIDHPQYLDTPKNQIIELFRTAKNKELKWHLALMLPRLDLDNKSFGQAWDSLIKWAQDKSNSKLVRVGAVQGLYEMIDKKKSLRRDFDLLMNELEQENIPSVNARIRNIRKELAKKSRVLS